MDPTNLILSRFEQISAIPRGSKNEAQIRAWLVAWAAARGLGSAIDAAGNLVIRVPASAGHEDRPTLILQGHLDMVCEKTPDSTHDFLRDPITIRRDGDWLRADRTTLGADNGIAIALMMALVEAAVPHPPLELLLTVEEEVGLVGANNLDPTLITGKTLINLDSESEGTLTIGGAGGGILTIVLPARWKAVGDEEAALALRVGGLHGGHSGDDIHKHRANAIKLLARILDALQRAVPLRLAALSGGSARNAIPRDAAAVVVCAAGDVPACRAQFAAITETIRSEHAHTEPALALSLVEEAEKPQRAIRQADTEQGIRLLAALPTGVGAFSAEIPGFVETSNNLGVAALQEDGLHLVSSHRSAVYTRLEASMRQVEAAAWLAGAATSRSKINLPWTPNPDSALLKTCVQTYTALFGKPPTVKLIHAGLECGILSQRCGGLDVISLGPDVENPHSPDERMYVPSLPKVWDFLCALLAGGRN